MENKLIESCISACQVCADACDTCSTENMGKEGMEHSVELCIACTSKVIVCISTLQICLFVFETISGIYSTPEIRAYSINDLHLASTDQQAFEHLLV